LVKASTASVNTAPASVVSKPADKTPVATTQLKSADVSGILSKNSCSACHGVDNKIVGPSFKEIATKHGARADAVAYLVAKMKSGSAGVYGAIPMPAQAIEEVDAKKVAQWIAQGSVK
jgi:S-disulfanyl-L-cysteine oxidoreductase SoxD